MTQLATTTTPMWQGFAGSSIGKAHIDANLPNQDSVFMQSTNTLSVAVVCDGAGSAAHSELGAQFFSHAIGTFLLTHAEALLADAQAESLVRVQLTQIRDTLKQQVTLGSELRDYHATVTAVLLSIKTQHALVIQVGDSPLIHSRFLQSNAHIDYFNDVALLGDDSKNEYVNETHFITQDNWQDFLRVAWLDTQDIDMIALMSDGCADLVIEGATRPMSIYRPFFGNLMFNLCAVNDPAQGNQIIQEALANPATYRLTGDDKTLAVLIKQPVQYRGLEPVMTATNQPDTIAQTATSVWHSAQADTRAHHTVAPAAPSQAVPIQAVPINDKSSAPDTLPMTAQLPPTVPVTDSGKQRRTTALLAGTAVLLGAGTLAWLNQDKLGSKSTITANQAPSASLTAQTDSPVSQSTPALLPLKLDEPATATRLALPSASATSSQTAQASALPNTLSVIVGIPTDSQNQPLYTIHPKSGTLTVTFDKLTATASAGSAVASPASIAATASTANATVSINPKPKTLSASIRCQPIRGTQLDSVAAVGVAIDKTWQYQLCDIELPTKQLPPQASQVQLPNGLASLLHRAPTRATASASQAEAGMTSTGDSAQIQLYYLPTAIRLPATHEGQATASQVRS